MNGKSSLQQRHAQVLERIRASCLAHGRDPASVTLLAVSKTFPHTEVLQLAALGQQAFGENYLQEALEKIEACRAQRLPTQAGRPIGQPVQGPQPWPLSAPLQWHFIGPIQSNKTRPIAEHFDWVHSIDREKIALRLSEQRPTDLPPLSVCLQVNVSGEASKQGCDPAQAVALAHRIASLPRLRLRGLMAIPEPTDDVALQRQRFGTVRALLEQCRAEGLPMDTLSMGMSSDLDAAIAEGATLVRVGTALFGSRPPKAE